MKILIKRIYEEPAESDGFRLFVDRLWARGLSKEKARIDLWAKEIAPSNELRHWYGHDPDKWSEFKGRYKAELDANRDRLEEILAQIQAENVTLLYGSKERRLNNAAALKEYIEAMV